jgi:hypothetical protein
MVTLFGAEISAKENFVVARDFLTVKGKDGVELAVFFRELLWLSREKARIFAQIRLLLWRNF